MSKQSNPNRAARIAVALALDPDCIDNLNARADRMQAALEAIAYVKPGEWCPWCTYPYGYKIERSGLHPTRCPAVIAAEALKENE